MSTAIEQGAATTHTPTVGSLARAELMRLRSRRFVRWIVLLGFAVMLIVFVVNLVRAGTPNDADVARATQLAQQATQECVRGFTDVDQKDLGGQTPEQICTTDPETFLTKQPFTWKSWADGALAVAGGFAALLFLIGATAGGAEWAARTMPALLYWEPRRLRVMAVKIAVLAGCAAAVALVAQLVWLALSWILVAVRGPSGAFPLADRFWSDSIGAGGRGVLLGMLAALGAYALANLTRNTGAALGVAFVYLAFVENVIGAVRPAWTRWLLQTNVGAFITPDGLSVTSGISSRDPLGGEFQQSILISNLRGGIVLTIGVVVFLVVATVLFQRRDVA